MDHRKKSITSTLEKRSCNLSSTGRLNFGICNNLKDIQIICIRGKPITSFNNDCKRIRSFVEL